MDYIIDTIEGRLQHKLGAQLFEIEILKQKLSEAYKEIEDLKSKNQVNGE